MTSPSRTTLPRAATAERPGGAFAFPNGGGGGAFGGGGGGAGMGGAIFNEAGTVTIINSTLAGNTAKGGSRTDGTS